MVPKRRDPPTKKGKEKAGSSSSRHRPLETNVDVGGIRSFRGSRGRTNLQQVVNAEAYLGRTREFLANFNHAIEEPAVDHRYTTWVCGKWIKFSPPVIANYYGLTSHDFEPIPADFDMTRVTQFLYGRADAWPLAGPKFLHNQLTDSLRIFHIFVCHNIDPTSHRTNFKESQALFLYHLASGHKINLGEHIFRFIVDLASQYASGRSPMFSCLINVLCLANGVPFLPHEEPESPESPIIKQTLGNHLSEQGRVLNSIQRAQLAVQHTVDHMRIEMESLKESNNTLRGGQRTINFTYDDVNHRMLQFAQRLDDIYTVVSQPSAPSAPHHGSAPDGPPDHPGPSPPHLPPKSTSYFLHFI
ncbi:JmjC domain-containing protein [Abeliophyllum distichum]|uniref:JmjC domain-containing protein n=1 Tax=Abeliophyllum distichum TaxID=126358 RepID=A0ABD1V2P5_9LAMI